MVEVVKPTCKELFDAGIRIFCEETKSWVSKNKDYELVDSQAKPDDFDDTNIIEVYYRKRDSTYWEVSYYTNESCDYNGLEDGKADITQVCPRTEVKEVTTYIPVE